MKMKNFVQKKFTDANISFEVILYLSRGIRATPSLINIALSCNLVRLPHKQLKLILVFI